MAPRTPYVLLKLSLHLAATLPVRPLKRKERGFVLPIAILIVVVLLLITSLLLSRAFNRNLETSVTRTTQIANRRLAAAFDRARAKLDFLLDPKTSSEDKYTGAGEPSDSELRNLLTVRSVYTLRDETPLQITSTQEPGVVAPAWWFPVDDDQDGRPDSISAYMIVHNVRRARRPSGGYNEATRFWNDGNPISATICDPSKLNDPTSCTDAVKAALLQVRNGPLDFESTAPGCEVEGARVNIGDWFTSSSTTAELLKPFQVFAVNIPLQGESALSSAVAAAQMQHDRVRESLARWAAWFRYDLEVYQTRDFQWNGAVHTEGSYILGAANLDPADPAGGQGFRHYLISAPESCFYLPKDNSEISIRGELISAELGNNRFVRAAANLVPFRIDLHPNLQVAPTATQIWTLTDDQPIAQAARDSVIPRTRTSETTPVRPDSMALDPLAMIASDEYYPRDPEVRDTTQSSPWSPIRDRRAGLGWDDSPLSQGNPPEFAGDGRVKVNDQGRCAPYVDDTYRADNRFGPKLSYQPEVVANDQSTCSAAPFASLYRRGSNPVAFGELIDSGVTATDPTAPTVEQLIRNDPPAGAGPEEVGLDGYWERRARIQGLRIIVGQRLELNQRSIPYPLNLAPNPADPLNVSVADSLNWRAALMSNQARQRQTFQDNLAAVQATAVYHYSQNSGFFPVACLATTVHPGTPATLRQSSTFGNPIPAITGATVLPDFFFGGMPVDLNGDGATGGPLDLDWDGTNVWEFEPPAADATTFANSLGANQLLGKALRNLAYFAGDPDGAYPPLQEAGRIHPDPLMTAFGNFSELRAVLARLDSGVPYTQLSLAEQTTLQTAACTVRMLAYNLNSIRQLPDDASGLPQHPLEQDIRDILADGVINNTIDGGNSIAPTNRPRHTYLPLYYLFPGVDHPEQRQGAPAITQANTGWQYQRITLDDLGNLALNPRPINNWVTPNVTIGVSAAGCGSACPESNRFNLIRVGSELRRVAFKDRAFFDGREVMSVRTLDIDLALLRNTQLGSDRWLPIAGGVVYAFREDAVREDAIARQPLPQTGGGGLTWANFLTAWQNSKANPHGASGDPFVMNAGQVDASDPDEALEPRDPSMDRGFDRALNPTEAKRSVGVGDPPLVAGATRGVSPKIVDYYPDPERRPYGFRLRNGRRLDRPADADGIRHGMSFITDNSVYIQGDFNLHQSNSGMSPIQGSGAPTLEDEFTTNPGGFYDRTGNNSNYARGNDTWRPTDILADSITILSNNFCDGSLDDGFLQDGALTNSLLGPQDEFKVDRSGLVINRSAYGCADTPANNVTSYISQPLIYAPTTWPFFSSGTGISAGALSATIDLSREPLLPSFNPNPIPADTAPGPFQDPSNPSGSVPLRLTYVRDTDLSPGQPGYGDFPVKVSVLGNPVIDTSNWVFLGPVEDGVCGDGRLNFDPVLGRFDECEFPSGNTAQPGFKEGGAPLDPGQY
ncbi:MAG: hypothetical protein Q6L58_10490, partial [Thermostichales cyanobacterium BF3_bins_165]